MIRKTSLYTLIATALMPVVVLAETLLFQGVETTGQSQYAILEASPDGSSLYAINNSVTPSVERFVVNSSGTLESKFGVSSSQAGLEGATSVAFSPDADVVLLGNNSGTGFGLYAFSLGDSGNGFVPIAFKNTNGGSLQNALFDSSDTVNPNINVTAVAISPDGSNIYVAGTEAGSGDGVVAVLGNVKYLPSQSIVEYTPLAAASQSISETDSAELAPLDTPVGMVAANKGVYVISSSTTIPDALIYLTRDENTGALAFGSVASSLTGVPQLDTPADILLATIDSKENIFIAAAGSSTIIQFEQTEAGVAPALKKIYGKLTDNGQPDVSGLSVVSRLVMNSQQTVLHAASTASSAITSFYVDDGLLAKSSDTSPVAQGGTTSSGVSINGIAEVNLLALGNSDEHLYAASSTSLSSPLGLAKFTRQSNLEVTVTSVIPDFVQPGQVTPFSVTVRNNGPADAPRFQLLLTPSHAVTNVSIAANSTDLASCVLRSESNSPTVFCEGAILRNGADFTVEVTMRPTRLTTASVSAQAASGNETSSESASARDSVTVGEAKNGSLAIGLWAHLLLLFVFVSRRFKD